MIKVVALVTVVMEEVIVGEMDTPYTEEEAGHFLSY